MTEESRRRRMLLEPVATTTWTLDAGTRYWATVSVPVYDVFIDGKLGTQEVSAAACDADTEWFWDSGTNRLYLNNTAGDPDTVPTEVKYYTQ